MATTISLDERLDALGFDPSRQYEIPAKAEDAALAAVDAFVREHDPEMAEKARGLLHMSSPTSEKNQAPIQSVGSLLTKIQGAVDAIGASLEGHRSSFGPIPRAITAETELALVAEPMPGSVVIQMAPASEPSVSDPDLFGQNLRPRPRRQEQPWHGTTTSTSSLWPSKPLKTPPKP